MLALLPPGVAPAFCVSVLLPPLSVGAPGCPCRAPPPVPPACPPVRGFHICVRRGLSHARLAGHRPVATPVAGTSRRAGRSSRPCGVCGHLVEGGGGCLLMARSACAAFGGCCSARTPWFPCVLLCVLLGLVSLPCVPAPPPADRVGVGGVCVCVCVGGWVGGCGCGQLAGCINARLHGWMAERMHGDASMEEWRRLAGGAGARPAHLRPG